MKPAAVLLILTGLSSGGCFVVPVPRSTKEEGTRGPITSDDTRFIQEGTTTLEELLLALGEPDYLDSFHVVYGWCGSKMDVYWGYVIPGPPYAAGAGGGVKRFVVNELFLVEFDRRHRVRRFEFLAASGSQGEGPWKAPPSIETVLREWSHEPTGIPNPEYAGWSAFPVGSWRVYTSRESGKSREYKDSLVERSDSKAILERSQGDDRWRVTIFAWLPSPNGFQSTEKGEEALDTPRGRRTCRWVKSGMGVVSTKTWVAEDIPGGWLKVERHDPFHEGIFEDQATDWGILP
jgi:hypothetical protein